MLDQLDELVAQIVGCSPSFLSTVDGIERTHPRPVRAAMSLSIVGSRQQGAFVPAGIFGRLQHGRKAAHTRHAPPVPIQK